MKIPFWGGSFFGGTCSFSRGGRMPLLGDSMWLPKSNDWRLEPEIQLKRPEVWKISLLNLQVFSFAFVFFAKLGRVSGPQFFSARLYRSITRSVHFTVKSWNSYQRGTFWESYPPCNCKFTPENGCCWKALFVSFLGVQGIFSELLLLVSGSVKIEIWEMGGMKGEKFGFNIPTKKRHSGRKRAEKGGCIPKKCNVWMMGNQTYPIFFVQMKSFDLGWGDVLMVHCTKSRRKRTVF